MTTVDEHQKVDVDAELDLLDHVMKQPSAPTELTDDEMRRELRRLGIVMGAAVLDANGRPGRVTGIGRMHKPHSETDDKRPDFYVEVTRVSPGTKTLRRSKIQYSGAITLKVLKGK